MRLGPLLALVLLPACDPVFEPRPAVEVVRLDEGAFVDLLGGDGTTPLVVNLFATWCSACRGELPVLDRFARERTGVRFAAVSLDEAGTTRAVQDYASSLGLSLPVYHLAVADPVGVVGRHLDAFHGAIPITVVLGEGGRVRAVHPGRADRADLESLLDEARGGVAAPP